MPPTIWLTSSSTFEKTIPLLPDAWRKRSTRDCRVEFLPQLRADRVLQRTPANWYLVPTSPSTKSLTTKCRYSAFATPPKIGHRAGFKNLNCPS